MLTELYSLVLWTAGGFSAFLYVLEALGIYTQGLGILDPILTGGVLYSAARLGKESSLSPLKRAFAVAPVVLLIKHCFELLPDNIIFAGISVVLTVALAVGIYQVL